MLKNMFGEQFNGGFKQFQVAKEAVECDPTANGADVGILSCGADQYCAESDMSSLGGFCTTNPSDESFGHRNLQNQTFLDYLSGICASEETSPNLSCETCEIDAAAYTASVKCTYTSYCAAINGLCGDGKTYDFCGVDNRTVDVTGPGLYTYGKCFSMTTPLEFTYCDSFTQSGPEDFSCDVSINGVTCNSCELYYNPSTGGLCQGFNCENTDLGTSGSTCSVSFVQALAVGYLYSTLPCPNGCNLCGEGGTMTNAGANFTLPDGYSISCFVTQNAALTGYFATGDYCTTLPPLVEEPCGCSLAPGQAPAPGAPAPAPGAPEPAPGPTQGGSEPGAPTPSPDSGAATLLSHTVAAMSVVGASMLASAFAG
jgi:hypothetical protein